MLEEEEEEAAAVPNWGAALGGAEKVGAGGRMEGPVHPQPEEMCSSPGSPIRSPAPAAG